MKEKKRLLELEIALLKGLAELLDNLIECNDYLSGLPRNTLCIDLIDNMFIDAEDFPVRTSVEDEAFIAGFARFIKRYASSPGSPSASS